MNIQTLELGDSKLLLRDLPKGKLLIKDQNIRIIMDNLVSGGIKTISSILKYLLDFDGQLILSNYDNNILSFNCLSKTGDNFLIHFYNEGEQLKILIEKEDTKVLYDCLYIKGQNYMSLNLNSLNIKKGNNSYNHYFNRYPLQIAFQIDNNIGYLSAKKCDVKNENLGFLPNENAIKNNILIFKKPFAIDNLYSMIKETMSDPLEYFDFSLILGDKDLYNKIHINEMFTIEKGSITAVKLTKEYEEDIINSTLKAKPEHTSFCVRSNNGLEDSRIASMLNETKQFVKKL
jgi:hypothetical protein